MDPVSTRRPVIGDRPRSRGWRIVPADAWCWWYFLVAPAIGGALMWFGVGLTESGGDYCDPVYSSASERDADFRAASLAIAVGAVLMIACGIWLLINLYRCSQLLVKYRRARSTLAVMVSCVALAGYAFILVVGSDFSSDCGGIRL